ncbi:MAG: Stf0 family sulfotransferase [Methylovulum sp.]|nr:Stf0 family sulfotransferase [Methylovulum sp.]
MKCAIVAQARGEEYIVNQWIAYHLMIGFDKIFLFDHLSDPPLSDVVDKAFEDKVELRRVTKDAVIQRAVYDYAFRQLCNDMDWIAFIDLDEFIVLKNHGNIKDFLAQFPADTGCVLLHWECFTSQGYENNPDGCIFDNYTQSIDYKAPQNTTVKSIARREALIHASSVHIPKVDTQAYKIRFIDGSEPNSEFYQNHVDRVFHYPPNAKHWDDARIYHFMVLSKAQVTKKLVVQKNTNIKEAPRKYSPKWIAQSYPKKNIYINEFAKNNLSSQLQEVMSHLTGQAIGIPSEDATQKILDNIFLTKNISPNNPNPNFVFPFHYEPSVYEKELTKYFGSNGLNIDGHLTTDPKLQNYIICFSSRCGANYLSDLLAMDGQMGNAGLALNYDVVIAHSEKQGFRHIQDYVAWLIKHTTSAQKIFGTKLVWEQLYFLTKIGVIPHIIKSPRFIHIHRKDVVGQAIAIYISTQTGQASSKQNPPSVKFNPQQIIRLIETIELSHSKFMMYFKLFNANYINIAYEDILSNEAGAVKNIVQSLGINLAEEISLNGSTPRNQEQSSELHEEFREMLQKMYGFENHKNLSHIKTNN